MTGELVRNGRYFGGSFSTVLKKKAIDLTWSFVLFAKLTTDRWSSKFR